MKRFFAFSVLLIGAGAALSSCERCSECSYTYRLDAVDTSRTYSRTCGKKSDVDAYEERVRLDAVKVGGTVTCTEE